MSERALMGQRALSKNIPALNSNFADGTGWSVSAGWEKEGNLVYYETYWDLSGYTMDDLTTVIDLILLQDSGAYFSSAPSEILVNVLDVVSDVPLNMAEVDNLIVNGDLPGTPGSTADYEQIKYCNLRGMTTQTDFGSVTLLRTAYGGSYGSAEPTTNEKLYIYRIIRPAATDLSNATLSVPATRFIAGITVIKEDDRPYLMRQKRSYELQQLQ